ncbi:OmpP1/FadL family transporter [Psychrobacter sp. H8-1]|uniref:OmpP1/FadL family transporter n=1 Tax=Psychrobacter sp. H8-1 TaxID=2774129 RepID=UPI0019185A09|nr:outer membrane protein transport protein [Psychrobacter sp. H8-1]
MRATFHLKTLSVAVAALSVASFASAAGLDRSGQDITAFLQDGTYAETVYTYINADVTGVDNDGNKSGDIAESYDFFRYGVKTDINNRFSVGVLYDEPFGAAAKYEGDNNFTGVADITGAGAIQTVAQTAVGRTQDKIDQINTQIAGIDAALANPNLPPAQQQALNQNKQVLGLASVALTNAVTGFESLNDAPTLENYNGLIESTKQNIAQTEGRLNQLSPGLSPETNQLAQTLLDGNKADLAQSEATRDAVANLLSIDEATNVEVRSHTLSLIGGMKFGAQNQFQVYGGPVAQRLEADVKLRGNAYKGAAGYTAHISPDQDYGWLAGISYSKPEIALKAALTYRSEIDHTLNAAEYFPALAIRGLNPNSTTKFEVTTPESVNLDLQTGVNPTTLATAKVRWVPWGDFAIRPPVYTQASNLPLVDYDKDQWQVELGLGKRLAPKLAVSGTVGWDSGAGNPVSSLGPIEGYYSVGLGAKYDVTENWAVSAGGKYLWFGDAEGSLPDGDVVSNFEDNDGYVLGVKVSYQAK